LNLGRDAPGPNVNIFLTLRDMVSSVFNSCIQGTPVSQYG
jgi:hypothetical protein